MKLGNFAALDPEYPGVGLTSGGRADADVWDRYHENPEELAALASALREAAITGSAPPEQEEDEDEVEEGRIIFRLHRSYERNRALRDRKKRQALRDHGKLACEVCGFVFSEAYGDELGGGFIEAHHVTPLSEMDAPARSALKDLALVCCNCHRMLHRSKPWMRPQELRGRMGAQVGLLGK